MLSTEDGPGKTRALPFPCVADIPPAFPETDLTHFSSYDVAIVGCGPVGALLANLLGRYGLHVVALEREATAYSLPRAAHLDDEALRILQAVGVVGEALAHSRAIDGLDVISQRGEVLLRARKENAGVQPFGFPSATLIHQPTVEAALRSGIRRFPNVEVCLGHGVDRVAVVGEHIQLDGEGPAGPFSVSANWLVGCDGARSLVRETMGSPLKGGRLEQPWLVVDVVLKKAFELPNHLLQIADPRRPTTYVPFADPRRRWEFMLLPGETAEDITAPEAVRALLSAHVNPDVVDVERAAVYTFRDATVRGWRNGRMLIAGDAAHQMPPFLGQGLCAGFRDVHNLAWKLALVAKGAADKTLLDSYETERRPHVQAITKLAVRAGRIIQAKGVVAGLRDRGLRTLHRLPALRERLLHVEGRIPHAPLAFSGAAAPRSSLLPQPSVEKSNGEYVLLDAFLGDGFALIGLGVSPSSWVEEGDLATWQKLITRSIHVVRNCDPWPNIAEGEVAVRDHSGVLVDWAGIDRGIVVIRPDRHAFGVYGLNDWPMAAESIREALGLV